MADYYVKSGSGVTERANSTAYALGARMVPLRTDTSTNHLVAKAWVWECTTAGTSGASVPSWSASYTKDVSTITDGTVVWTARTPGFSSGSTVNWTFASPFFEYAALNVTSSGPDRLLVSSTHSQSSTSINVLGGLGLNNNIIQVLCVNDSAAPPTLLATGALVQTSGGNLLLQTRSAYFYGMTFQAAFSAVYGGDAPEGKTEFDTCELRVAGGGTITPTGSLSSGPVQVPLTLRNCVLNFATTSQELRGGNYYFTGGGIKSGSASPSALFNSSNSPYIVRMEGFDLSALGASFNFFSNNQASTCVIRNCKLPASWSGSLNVGTTRPNARYEMYNCDSADTNYRLRIEAFGGSIFSETTVVRTDGASDGTTPLSWRMVGNTNCAYFSGELYSPEIVRWNETVGSSVTATVEVLTDNVTLTDAECWIEVQYLGTSGTPLSLFSSDRRAGILTTPANQASSSVAWTTTGITTPVKQKLSVTFTPQEKGFIHAVVKLARASTTVYVDPKLEVT